ncbi:MAG: hypothetical protein HY831_04585 [Candidatus Aenigmarchaeota archaeon]|nr:hypothetical protein [Candidatus Aenigmarchaeota archaeon]
MIKFIRGSEAYYNEATRLLKTSKTFICLAKTPTAFLSSQRTKPWQFEFYDAFKDTIQNRDDIKIRYIFSLPLTKEELVKTAKLNKEQSLDDLNAWLVLSKDSRVDFSTIEYTAPFSFIIGDHETALLLIYPNGERACLVLSNKEVPYYLEYFNQLAEKSNKNNDKIISEIKKHIEEL